MGRHVGPKCGLAAKVLLAVPALEAPLAGVDDQVRAQVVLVAKDFVTKVTGIDGVVANPLALHQLTHGGHGGHLRHGVVHDEGLGEQSCLWWGCQGCKKGLFRMMGHFFPCVLAEVELGKVLNLDGYINLSLFFGFFLRLMRRPRDFTVIVTAVVATNDLLWNDE